MSITSLLPSELYHIEKDKDYRKSVKNRLKELAESGDSQAEEVLNE